MVMSLFIPPILKYWWVGNWPSLHLESKRKILQKFTFSRSIKLNLNDSGFACLASFLLKPIWKDQEAFE